MTTVSDAISLSVVIPVYNEEKNIRETLRKVSAFLSLKKISWEIIVVSDGSTDKTHEILDAVLQEQPASPFKVLKVKDNHGKGYASRAGILEARGRYVLMTDADLSAPIKEVDKLIVAIEKGADVAIGSRAVRSPGCDVRQSLRRRISGRIFNFFVQLFVLRGIQDSQCGFKCFTNSAAKRIFPLQKLEGFSFDVEILFLARKCGYKIAEVPVMWSQGLDSRISLLRDSIRMLKDLLKIKKLHGD